MNFDSDDPLAGILSDGSDDSFFDDDILGKKKPVVKKKDTPIAEKKNALFDLGDDETKLKVTSHTASETKNLLFDLENEDLIKVPPIARNSEVKVKTPSPAPFKRTVSKESIKTVKDFTINDFGSTSPAKSKPRTNTENKFAEIKLEHNRETIKPSEKGKSSSLLDDILGEPSTKQSASNKAAKSTTATKSKEFALDSILGKSESKLTVSSSSTKATKVENNPKSDDIQEAVKDNVKKKTNASNDWLGIFKDKNDKEDDEDSGMPSWLIGGDSKKKPNKESKLKSSKPEPPAKSNANGDENNYETNMNNNIQNVSKVTPSAQILQDRNDDLTAEGAALYLQQQESQLMVALQLKAQEEKLVAMQMRQEETARVQREEQRAQHSQLDAMLRRQAAHRQQMQAAIAAHQERIADRIKAMLGPPTEDQGMETEENLQDTPAETKESPHSKEKKQLLQLVQSLQENHDKEVDLMETSYRRQLAFLEISLNQSEERMKEESDKLVKFYTEKIIWLEEHHEMHRKLTEDNLNSMSERHKSENELLRKQHLENVRILQEHHASLMENIKNAVKQEHALLQDSSSFSSNLMELVAEVKDSKSQCQYLVEKIQTMSEGTQKEQERSLQMREAQIRDMMEHLNKQRETFDTEKTENREMVKLLESRLKQMTTLIEEENASLKQKRMEFEFEKATFSKQTEFAKNVLKRQDEEIKMLKDDIQKEYNDKIARIDEEKAKALKDTSVIAKERASIQSLRQELEKMKAELQAQLEEAAEERSRLNFEKQQMHMEEQRILAKTRDLDLLTKTAIEKQSQADKKYTEAEFIQRKYEDRIRRIQEHVVSLNSREKQIAREKVALSRERLSLHNERKEIESRQQCSLCKNSHNMPQYQNIDQTYNLPDSFINASVCRDFGSTNMTSVMNNIETEMAHLIGRNFGLRNSVSGLHRTVNLDNVYDEHDKIEQVEIQERFKDYNDPKLMMLRLDVQQVISNLDQNKTDEDLSIQENREE